MGQTDKEIQMNKAKEMLAKLKDDFSAFAEDAEKLLTKGNKAAGTRTRVTSIRMDKAFKDWRRVSVSL